MGDLPLAIMDQRSESSLSIAERIRQISKSIEESARRVGRDPKSISLVAATKTVPVQRMREAHSAGIQIFGENRLQEAQKKQSELADILTVSWHFIGQVQRRKIKDVVGKFDLIHSVESLEQARLMEKRAEALGLTQSVLLEVNVGGEETKGGYTMSGTMEALPELDAMPHLSVKGLMTIPPPVEDAEAARPYFSELRELGRRIKSGGFKRLSMEHLSMGMSQDYLVAIEEGATLVRVGTELFGARQRLT